MKKIAVTGASGYIASLVQRTNAGRFEFLPVRHKDLISRIRKRCTPILKHSNLTLC
jgi:predicted amino acid dehydrogenase